ncbi:MAG: hypothetical protein KKB89_03940 [Candidatus Omnitrophica bacterium]|nr:hypothetical protein [Candidatus Omnitrophota bacterium]MBU2504930.1 hypothetical protein [Candidatus Omnitrophota bacterium]
MMVNNKDFEKLNQELGFEFNKYVLMHSEILDKIPPGAQVVFLLDNNPEFNVWSKRVNEKQREANQPFIFVHIEKLLNETCRVINPHVEATA